MTIRPAISDDLSRIVEIYNEAVADRRSADLEPVTTDQRRPWLKNHNDRFPVIVAEADSDLVGWLSISAYRPGRGALENSAEVSYYIDYGFHSRGYGSALMEAALNHCSHWGIDTLFAIVLENNHDSIGLLEKFGFEQWGRLPDIANFHGERIAQLYYGRKVDG